jgi:large subunit ribosomal protein L10
MSVTRQQKELSLAEIAQKLETSNTVYLTDYKGLTVAQVNELRGRFRAAGVDYKVLKNTLIRLAMERKGGYDAIYEYLNGPTAVAFAEEPSAPARVIKKFLSDTNIDRPQLKAAYVDGAVYSSDALDVLATLKSKNELIGDIIGLLLSPMANVIGALQAPGATIVGALQTLAEREG